MICSVLAKFGFRKAKVNGLLAMLAKPNARITSFGQRIPILVALKLKQIAMRHRLSRAIIGGHAITLQLSHAALERNCHQLLEMERLPAHLQKNLREVNRFSQLADLAQSQPPPPLGRFSVLVCVRFDQGHSPVCTAIVSPAALLHPARCVKSAKCSRNKVLVLILNTSTRH